ncbi:MAG: DUF935 domain-containing protein [Candidatus Kapabacteria bacterium]|nr:DUF935 domain-containing protein [Candidatus Kapabacteria bacterium]
MSKNNLFSELVSRENQEFLFRIMNHLPNPDKILRKTGKTIEAYRDLKNDPHVWSCIQSRKSGLLGLEYTIAQNNSRAEVVKFIEEVFNSLDINQIQRDILEAPLFGYQPMEVMWRQSEGQRQYLVPTDIIAKPQEWFFFDIKGNLKFKKSGVPDGVSPPPMKILNVQYEPSYLNPYGHSLLSKCYWSVTFKNGGIKFWVNFTEKYGMPLILGHYTRGASSDEIQKLADVLADMAEDSVIVSPSDIKIEMQEAVRYSSISLYKELIKFCNAEISKAILSQTLTTEIEMGSLAASQTHFKVRKEVILSDIKLVERTLNKLIQWIVELNFGNVPSPSFKIILNDSDNSQKIERDLKISQTGTVRLSKKYWMNSYGFNEDEVVEI